MTNRKNQAFIKEIMPTLIFTTLILLIVVFASFFYYVCSLPAGCQYNWHFLAFFGISFALFVIMLRVEKQRVKAFLRIIFLPEYRKSSRIDLPLDEQLVELHYLNHNFNSLEIKEVIDKFCLTFKEMVGTIVGYSANASYEDLILHVDYANINPKLKKDLTKILKFLRVLRYKDADVSKSEIKSFIKYAADLGEKFNRRIPDRPKTSKNFIDNTLSKHSNAIGILFIFIVLFSGMYLTGSNISGFSFTTTEGTGGSVTIHTIIDQTVVEGHTNSILVTANDSDSEELIFDIGENDPSWVTITTTSNTTTGGANAIANLSFLPPSTGAVANNYEVTVTARSQDNDAAAEAIYINVTDNTAPTQDTPVPNMTWPEAVVNDTFDLDDYFSDTDGDHNSPHQLNYTYSGNTNITIAIVAGAVTLTPDTDWYGAETITFTASDGIDTTDSNPVIMNVTNVYDALTLVNASIVPFSANNVSNLTCLWYVTDPDLEANITVDNYWYEWNGSDFVDVITESNIACSVNAECTGSIQINDTATLIDEIWNCTVNASDQTTVVTDSATITIASSPPDVINLSVNSDPYNRTIVTNDADFNISWSDLDSGSVAVYVCNSSTVNVTTGCDDTQICYVNYTTTTDVNCSYTTNTSDNATISVWVFACDDYVCSAGNESTFYTNRPPVMNYTTFNLSTNEVVGVCTGNYSDASFTNEKTILKFNISDYYDWNMVNTTNASLMIDVQTVGANWSNSLTIAQVINQTWLESTFSEDLGVLVENNTANFTTVNDTGQYDLLISDLVQSTYKNNHTNLSLILYHPSTSGMINESRNSTGFLGAGDNDTSSDYGNILFSNETYLSANVTRLISDYTWNMNTILVGPDLDDYFIDPDGYTMTYTFGNSTDSSLSISINNDTNVVTFTPTSNWYGSTSAIFIATDGAGEEMTSNTLALTVEYVDSTTETPTSSSSSSSSDIESVSLKVRASDMDLDPTDSQKQTIIIENDGDVDISSIAVDINAPDIDGLTVVLVSSSITSLKTATNATVTLTAESESVASGEYNISIIASSDSPKPVSDTENFMIEIVQYNATILTKINFVEDLFRTNQECLELMEHLTTAKALYNQGQLAKANQFLDEYIAECHDRIASDKFSPKLTNPETYVSLFANNRILLIIGLAIISALYIVSLRMNKS
jgi:large repetitive protein